MERWLAAPASLLDSEMEPKTVALAAQKDMSGSGRHCCRHRRVVAEEAVAKAGPAGMDPVDFVVA